MDRTTTQSRSGKSIKCGTDRQKPRTGRTTCNDSLWFVAGGSALPVSCRRIGSANGNRTRGLPFRFSPVGPAWMYFQYGWYARRLRNTTTNRRRHSAVTAQPWADGRGRGCGATESNCSLFDPRPVCEVRFTNRGGQTPWSAPDPLVRLFQGTPEGGRRGRRRRTEPTPQCDF
jgi:hypothetical protein